MNSEFIKFTKQYKKFYGTETEKDHRFRLFSNAYYKIEIHNSDDSQSYKLGINQFADLTEEEFEDHLGLLNVQVAPQRSYLRPSRYNLTASIDWVQKGKVARVKNQGGCGSCYAFCTIGALESLHAINHGKIIEFSEQEIVDCSWDYGNNGCNGGWTTTTYDYIIDNGIASEADYGYKGYEQTCKASSKERVEHMGGYHEVPMYDNNDMLKSILQQPMSIVVDASSSAFRYYKSGVVDRNCGTAINHGVMLVGAGTQDGIDFWKIKNSWGAGWGDDGFIKILRESGHKQGVCQVNYACSYPTY